MLLSPFLNAVVPILLGHPQGIKKEELSKRLFPRFNLAEFEEAFEEAVPFLLGLIEVKNPPNLMPSSWRDSRGASLDEAARHIGERSLYYPRLPARPTPARSDPLAAMKPLTKNPDALIIPVLPALKDWFEAKSREAEGEALLGAAALPTTGPAEADRGDAREHLAVKAGVDAEKLKALTGWTPPQPDHDADAIRMTITEAAKFVGVTDRTIREWRANGKLHVVQDANGHLLFSKSTLQMLRDSR